MTDHDDQKTTRRQTAHDVDGIVEAAPITILDDISPTIQWLDESYGVKHVAIWRCQTVEAQWHFEIKCEKDNYGASGHFVVNYDELIPAEGEGASAN